MSIISVSTVKSYLGITGTSSDAVLTMQTNLVEGEVAGYLNKNLAIATYTNEILKYRFSKFDNQFNPELDTYQDYRKVFLANYPVTSFTSLMNGTETVSTNDYALETANGEITLYSSISDEKNNLKANYVAGYTEETLPEDLKFVILEGVKQLYASSGTVSQGSGNVESKRVGDFAVSYKDNFVKTDSGFLKRYLAESLSTLNRYRKVNI